MLLVRVAAVGGSLALGALLALSLPAPAADGRAPQGAQAAERAARDFLASLSHDLRQRVRFGFDSKERLDWHFVPRQRVGASLLDLDDAQSELLGPLLATALSPEGLLDARAVVKHENILRRIETAAGYANASRRDPGLYFTTVFGEPGPTMPWAWRFEGHHLSINVTQIRGEPPIVAPVFMGANPARVPSGPEAGLRLLADEEDFARELVSMLPDDRRKIALISDRAFSDILTGNDVQVRELEHVGLAAADMTAAEQRQLRRLIEVYTSRLTPASAADALRRLDGAGFGKVRFAWAGGIAPGDKHYYRVHGPTLLIEYDNTQNDGNHIHTVYRDLQRDFGGDLLRRHLASAHPLKPHLSEQ